MICLLCIFVSSCSLKQDEIISTSEVDEEVSKPEKDTENTASDEENYADEFTEINETERFRATASFEITEEVYHEDISDYYCSVNEDGTLELYLNVTSGTPFSIEGAIYDHNIFTMKEYTKSIDSDAAGGGSTIQLYRFTPLKAGETEIVTLNKYIVKDIYEGYIYNITVEDDLTCHINWCGNVTEGENLKVYE